MLTAPVLNGPSIRLEPLAIGHDAAILAAAADPAIWRHTPLGGSVGEYLAAAHLAHAGGEHHVFVVIEAGTRTVVGMTRLFDIDEGHRRCEIGFTWYVPRAWGTAVNPQAKLLLMRHAFEEWGMRRVQLKTDHENLRSQAAIAKLGAIREGVLRAHMVRPDGSRRDTVMFSVTDDEWPAVKAGLERRIGGVK
jgi:RimJ/RimL family protein N-acetyltransferase